MTNGEKCQGIEVTGQVAMVTGGGRGIGRAIAQALAKAGASVAVVARTEGELAETVRLIEEAGGRARVYPADVTDQEAIEQIVAAVEQHLGPIDLLVSNATEVTPENWTLFRRFLVQLGGPGCAPGAALVQYRLPPSIS